MEISIQTILSDLAEAVAAKAGIPPLEDPVNMVWGTAMHPKVYSDGSVGLVGDGVSQGYVQPWPTPLGRHMGDDGDAFGACGGCMIEGSEDLLRHIRNIVLSERNINMALANLVGAGFGAFAGGLWGHMYG
jgi:hypothetical protein